MMPTSPNGGDQTWACARTTPRHHSEPRHHSPITRHHSEPRHQSESLSRHHSPRNDSERGPNTGQNALIERLTAEIDELLERQHIEVRACVDKWRHASRQHTAQPSSLLHNAPAPNTNSSEEPSSALRPALEADAESFMNVVPGVVPSAPENSKPAELTIAGMIERPPDLECKAVQQAQKSEGCGPQPQASKAITEVITAKSRASSDPSKKRKAADPVFGHGRNVSFTESRHFLEKIVSSRYYEHFSGGLIIANAIFIGWQTEFLAQRTLHDLQHNRTLQIAAPAWFLLAQTIFALLFAVELGLRWINEGIIDFFRVRDSMERGWNFLDVFVVTAALLDVALELVLKGQANSLTGNISVLRMLRLVRIVRVFRIIRVMRFFRELRMMIYSIIGSMKSLLWVALVLALVFYIFGISFTSATMMYFTEVEFGSEPTHSELLDYFGTLDKSFTHLMMAITGGNDWGMYWEALSTTPLFNRLLFLFYITFGIFAVMNIVTGIFVMSAIECNHSDKEIVVAEELENKRSYLAAMHDVFQEMDGDGSGFVTLEEFERRLNDERVIAYFHHLKLDVSDARTLFDLLDFDLSNEVNITEFLNGCYNLQGESRNLDVKMMQAEVHQLKELVIGLGDAFTHLSGRLCPTLKPLPTRAKTHYMDRTQIVKPGKDMQETLKNTSPKNTFRRSLTDGYK